MTLKTTPNLSSPRVSAKDTGAVAHPTERHYWSTSVGTKALIAVTGLLLIIYLVLHLAGNLLLYFGPPTFNAYAHFLIANPLIVPIEIGLLAVFLIHVFKAMFNYRANRAARPVQYYQPVRRFFGWGWVRGTSRKSFASTTMIFTGLITLIFVIIHVNQLKFGPEYLIAAPGGGEIRDLYRLEIETFKNVLNVVFYVFCMVVIGFHLWHGFSSSFNSLGVNTHPRYTRWILTLGKVVAIVIAGGFLTIPLWVYFRG